MWALAILAILTMTFFLANYVNIVAWHIRAQNAAASAASVALGVQGNVWNEQSTILYATAVNENRIRYLNQAILNTINGIGGCTGTTCDQNYRTLVAEYQQAVNALSSSMQVLQEGNNFTEGGQQADQRKAVGSIGGNCSNFDCAFDYTVNDVSQVQTGGSYPGDDGSSIQVTEADIVVCHNVPYFVPKLMNMVAGSKFQAVGRAAAILQPLVSESFNPGAAVNPSTNQVYQPVEAQWASAYPSAAYTVDYSSLIVNLNWYGAAPIAPYKGALSPGSYSCS